VEEGEEAVRKKVLVPTPENMDLGLDKRGNVLNNSNQKSLLIWIRKECNLLQGKGGKGKRKNLDNNFL
jgi:hypothetical protein